MSWLSRHRPFMSTSALALSMMPGAILAGTDTGEVSVTVNVVEICSIAGGSLDFGTYESGQTGSLPAQGTITYSGCNPGTVNVALDGGQAGNENLRSMSDGNGNLLNYYIFKDAARTEIWGTDARSADLAVDASGSGTWTTYGRILRDQSVSAGTYSDAVHVTVTF